ncbi:putative basic proline-rich protein-like [Iris pallida]|uniref:Basic proline-rich protein-like n=1 Tax=Iris pallida TaxID=29817 RepID=A0AAX6EHN8_IRIPA|nr:putative basic proline-rich protein-like [Iris pallida]
MLRHLHPPLFFRGTLSLLPPPRLGSLAGLRPASGGLPTPPRGGFPPLALARWPTSASHPLGGPAFPTSVASLPTASLPAMTFPPGSGLPPPALAQLGLVLHQPPG